LTRKNAFIEAHIATLLREGSLYLGKIGLSISRDFFQASCGIGGFVEEKSILSFKEGRGQNK